MKQFVHLHNHTEYSLLDGCARINKLVEKAVKEGAPAVAITDHGSMYGAIKFYKACKDAKIKPIIGCEVYVCHDITKKSREDNDRFHLVLLAKNFHGYQNLTKLVSIAFVDGFYEKPRIDYNLLKQYSEDLICLSGCIAGEISQILLDPNIKDAYGEALKKAKETKELFAEGDYYIEIQNHFIKEELAVMPQLKKIAKELGVKTVATNDLHYVQKTDAKAHDVLLCIQTAKDYDDPSRMKFEGEEFYYKTYDEMLSVIKDEEILDNTLEIAEKIDLVIPFKDYLIPYYAPPKDFDFEKNGFEQYKIEKYVPAKNNGDDAKYLRYLAYKGLKNRYGEITPQINERAEYELYTIITMGFASYYLIVWDFIDYAKSKDIPVGAGRGSGVGSIVAYAIKITDVDPLKYDLIFERFLNSSRQTMPDFDIDFCSDRREEVIEYVRNKYGSQNVAQIITFGKMKKKNAIKNVARVFKMPFAEANALVKNIKDNDKSVTIKNLIDPNDPHKVQELIDMYENPQYKEIIDLAMEIEDMPRDRGKNAAGVIICPVPVMEKVPLSRNGDDITTEYDMSECEELGLLKMDFLALKTLTDIKMTIDYVKKYEGVTLDFNELGYEDKEVYQMIGNGETDTVFQLESGGMKEFMKKLKPTLMEEIIAGVSLYRPGPMDFIPKYIVNKQNREDIDYRHPALVDILKTTYGICVYQEQAMRMTQALAGYSMNEADNFRKFISKKKLTEAEKQQKQFVGGCIKNGIDEKFANTIWEELKEFGKYAFNKSHAAAYAVLSYQTAYLKHYYPIEYLCAVINNRITNPDDTTKYLRLIKDMGIELLPPDINYSEGLFVPQGKAIRYGLLCAKNVGRNAIESVVKERESNGKFADFADFVRRVPSEAINRRMLESLIKGGAFDCFGYNRSTMMANYEYIVDTETSNKNMARGGQMFFEFMLESNYTYHIVPESAKLKLQLEKEVLGRYISGHPLDGHENEFESFNFNTSKLLPVEKDVEDELDDDEESYQVANGDNVYFGGILSGVTVKVSQKSGKPWGFAIIEDLYGAAEIVFFGNVYARYKSLLVEDNLVKIKGRINLAPGSPPKVEVMSVIPWNLEDKEIIVDNRTLCIKVDDNETCNKVLSILNQNKGPGGSVKIQKKEKEGYKVYNLEFSVAGIDMIKSQIMGIVGYGNVKIIQ
ncbi:DNA polymerase III subunit alpha [bacterium]|nr:DNA polymerase III subunit alpha [bacterium]